MDASLPLAELATKQLIEAARIQTFLKRAEIPTQKIDIQSIGELGYVINPKNGEKPVGKNGMLVLFDFDDVMNRTNDGVNELIRRMGEYAEKNQLHLAPADVTRLVRSVETFSSWKDGDPTKEIAHPNAQLLAMQYLLSEMKQGGPNHAQTMEQGIGVLGRIKKQNNHGEQTYQEGDPFRFNSRGTLTKLGDKHLWDQELEDMYLHSFFGPMPVKEMIQAAGELRKQGIEVGIFTSGDPTAQMMRILELLQAKGELPVSHMWLAKGDKGAFVQELMHDGNLEKRPDRTKSTLSAVDTIILFDDNPSVLNTVLQTNGKEHMPPFVGVRYRLANGYAEEKKWNPVAPNTEISYPHRLPLEGFLSLIQSIHTQVQQTKRV